MFVFAVLVIICLTAIAHLAVAVSAHPFTSRTGAALINTLIASPVSTWKLLLLQLPGFLVSYVIYFSVAILLSANASGNKRPLRLFASWGALSWLLLRCNAFWFPKSAWAWAMDPLFLPKASWLIDLVSSLWLITQIAVFFRLEYLNRKSRLVSIIVSVGMMGLMIAVSSSLTHGRKTLDRQRTLPNVIVIGLDSLRRDVALDSQAHLMPQLAAFRQGAYVQDGVVTPLARTFPSWVSILTGLAPSRSGARENLAARNQIASSASMAWTFKKSGYRTVYATDDTRFSNIGRNFGFDEVIAPTPGLPDLVLGELSDQPLINMAIQIPGMEYLLPALVGNRALAKSYRPRRFLQRLEAQLGSEGSTPTLLAVHLCLAHWPFAYLGTKDFPGSDGSYLGTLPGLDQQFDELLGMLRRTAYLDQNTLVVVLADHGESVKDSASRGSVDPSFVTPTAGHGLSLIDAHEWQIFTLFKGASATGNIPAGRSSQLASLTDLKPTILSLAGLTKETDDALDVAYASGVAGTPRKPLHATVTMETGFRPRGIDFANPNKVQAADIALEAFGIAADGRFEMKPDAYRSAIEDKDYGVADSERALLILNKPGKRLLVSVDLASGRADLRCDLSMKGTSCAGPIPLLADACRSTEMNRFLSRQCEQTAAVRPYGPE